MVNSSAKLVPSKEKTRADDCCKLSLSMEWAKNGSIPGYSATAASAGAECVGHQRHQRHAVPTVQPGPAGHQPEQHPICARHVRYSIVFTHAHNYRCCPGLQGLTQCCVLQVPDRYRFYCAPLNPQVFCPAQCCADLQTCCPPGYLCGDNKSCYDPNQPPSLLGSNGPIAATRLA